MPRDPKLLLIGWDAADWQVIDSLMAEDKMPNLKSMLRNGVRGNLATLQPVLSPMLWTSIATGKRAYDHGIHGFVEMEPASGEIRPVGSHSRNCKAIWNILNEAGLKTNVVNWWPSHPAEELDGITISNQFYQFPTSVKDWPLTSHSIFPESWQERLASLRIRPSELTEAHILPFLPQMKPGDETSDPVLQSIVKILAKTASVHATATDVLEASDWDFMAVYFEAIDHFSHVAMKYHPPQIPGVSDSEFEKYNKVIESAYRFHDMMLGRYLEIAGPDCNLMLISDHGFESGKMRMPQLPDLPAAPALEHRAYGVFAAMGPDIKRDQRVYGASLLDICPSILQFFGLPVGEDMEGQVLQQMFRRSLKQGLIPSWENARKQWQQSRNDYNGDKELSQLEQLGYINLPKNDKQKYVAAERSYNLCVSLMDGNRLKSATEEIERAYQQFGESRFLNLLLNCQLKSNQLEAMKATLEGLDQEDRQDPTVSFMRGLWQLASGFEEDALASFLTLEEKGVASLQLYNRMAESLLVAGKLKAARHYYHKALAMDGEDVTALTGMAQLDLENGHTADAMAKLDRSLALRYYQPRAHFLMAQAALKSGRPELARTALEVCLKQAPKHQQARQLYQNQFAESSVEKSLPIIIVSGLPRSGTSMMMQILAKGGLPLVFDDQRTKDEHNPFGYLEDSRVKDLGRDNSWLSSCGGQVLKVVSPLLRYLPSQNAYKVILMQRPLTEVILSQEVMKGRSKEEVMRAFPFQMAVDFENERKRILNWLELQPHIEFMEVEYYDCLDQPSQVAEDLSAFLGRKITTDHIKKATEKSLHRNKLGK